VLRRDKVFHAGCDDLRPGGVDGLVGSGGVLVVEGKDGAEVFEDGLFFEGLGVLLEGYEGLVELVLEVELVAELVGGVDVRYVPKKSMEQKGRKLDGKQKGR
jgi:hypothetical protein